MNKLIAMTMLTLSLIGLHVASAESSARHAAASVASCAADHGPTSRTASDEPGDPFAPVAASQASCLADLEACMGGCDDIPAGQQRAQCNVKCWQTFDKCH